MADPVVITPTVVPDPAKPVAGVGEPIKDGSVSRVSVNMDEKPAVTPEVKPEASPIPDKFKNKDGTLNTEALLKSYTELESSRGKPAEKPAEITPPTDTAKAITADDMKALSEEFAKNGKLSDESYKSLAGKGHSKEVVDTFIAGQTALAQQYNAALEQAVGGKERLTNLLEWAGSNLTAAEIESANSILKGGNAAAAKIVLDGLHARQVAAVGETPDLVNAEGSVTSGIKPFRSNEEMVTAMSDKRYKTDEAYRQDVAKRLAVTNTRGR